MYPLLLSGATCRVVHWKAMAVAVENFQAELDKARETLKGVDENIRKITGRDPTETRLILFTPSFTIGWIVR